MRYASRYIAALATGSLVAGAFVLPELQASAAPPTGVDIVQCSNFSSASPAAGIEVSITDTTGVASAGPTGQVIALKGTVSVTLPSFVTAGFKTGANVTQLKLTDTKINLAVTHANVSTLSVTGVTSPLQPIVANASDPNGYNPITYTVPNVSLGSVTTAGTAGQTVDVSLDDSTAATWGFGFDGNGLLTSIPGAANQGYLQTGGASNGTHGTCVSDPTGVSGTHASFAPSDISVGIASIPLATGVTSTPTPTPTPTSSTPPAAVHLKATVTAKKRVIAGKITGAGKGVANLTLSLKMQAKVHGKSTWKSVATLKTSKTGAYKSGKLKSKGKYEVVVAKQTVAGTTYAAFTSKTVTVK